MKKYGSPEPLRRVPSDEDQDSDRQGINVTAAREEPTSTAEEILNEGEQE